MVESNDMSIQPLKGGPGKKGPAGKSISPHDKSVPSFADTLKGFVKDVNKMQINADKSIGKMIAGEITDVHQVTIAVQEAKTAFNLMMEMRSKMMEAYETVMRMQV